MSGAAVPECVLSVEVSSRVGQRVAPLLGNVSFI